MSQATVVLPVSGVVSGATYAADNNAALDAIRTAWSGATAPATDTPAQGQWWLDTSQVGGGNFPILRQYDGSQWAIILVLDSTNHMMWSPAGPISTTTGTGAAYILSTSPYAPAAAPAKGFSLSLIVHTANTGACTINVNGIGAHPLRSASGVEIPAGALVANSIITITYLPATTEWIIDGFLAGSNPVPPGTVSKYAGFSAPSGYLFCNGVAVNRGTYANLMTAITIAQTGTLTLNANTVTGLTSTTDMQVGMPIESAHLNAGTTVASITSSTAITVSTNATANATETVTVFPWGNGDGSTTFNTPDLRGVTVVGSDTMGTTAANVAQVATNITTTITSPTATVASATGLAIGHKIVSVNVPYGTTITAISGTTITMSQNATASAGPTPARFSPFADAQISGATGGALTQTLQTAEIPSHNHPVTDNGHTHNMNASNQGNNLPQITVGYPTSQCPFSGGNPQCSSITISIASATTGISVAAAGGGSPHNTQSPGKIMKFIVKT